MFPGLSGYPIGNSSPVLQLRKSSNRNASSACPVCPVAAFPLLETHIASNLHTAI